MKIDTLKSLILSQLDKIDDKELLKQEIIRLLALFEMDNEPIIINSPVYTLPEEEMVPYGTYCSCNPRNGGSGICGCVMGNTLVPKRNQPYKIISYPTIEPFNYREPN